MKLCQIGEDCDPEPDAECFACIFQLSEIELKVFCRFLDEHQEEMHTAGLSLQTIKWIVDAITL